MRDALVDFVARMAETTELSVRQLVGWLGLPAGKFYAWRQRYGKAHEHNRKVPRDHWLDEWEKQSIVSFRAQYPLEGYRRLAYMMLDKDVVAVSPSSVYRVLRHNGLLDRWNRKASLKGTGFQQPLAPHAHWHVDISYLNLAGTFYYLCSVLDGYSRYLVHWEIRESMREAEVEIILQRAREKVPGATPRVISDNGPQFVAKDFKIFIREAGMTHVRTSPYYPQSNGKIERWHKTLKVDSIRPRAPRTKQEAERLVDRFVHHYNNVRLHSAVGYVAPADKLAGREEQIWAERDRKLEAAREARAKKRLCA